MKKENQITEKAEGQRKESNAKGGNEKNSIKEPRKEEKINCKKETMRMEGEEKKNKNNSSYHLL